jgi:glycerol uptake facilitator-like aquaporin
VLANDSDPSGLPLSVTQVTGLTNGSGTLSVNPNNTITFTPDIEFDGTATFSYTISNTHGGTATAMVSVNVLAPVPPTAGPDSATTPVNTSVTIDVLANDSDPNSLPLSIQQAGFPLHGSAATNPDNTITYTPNAGYQGVDTFIYVLVNSQGAIANGLVTVTVGP